MKASKAVPGLAGILIRLYFRGSEVPPFSLSDRFASAWTCAAVNKDIRLPFTKGSAVVNIRPCSSTELFRGKKENTTDRKLAIDAIRYAKNR